MRIRNVVAVCGISIAALVGPLAGVALAHVEVNATPDATQGGSAALSFEVPSEKEVSTVSVEIALPTETPILDVTVPPIDGWELSLRTAAAPAGLTGQDGQPVTEVVSSVVWTAIGVGIPPEESVDFVIGAGRLPTVDRISFPVAQTYSDGSVVSWAQESVDGAGEPDFPAPVIFLAPGVEPAPAAPTPSEANSQAPVLDLSESAPPSAPATSALSSADGATSASITAPTESPAVTDDSAQSSDSSNTTTIVVVAVIVVAALAGAGYAIVRRRQRS